jgi:hypothetical protein
MSPGTDAVAIGRAALVVQGDGSPHLDYAAQDDLVAATGEAPSLGPWWGRSTCTATPWVTPP